MRHSPFDIEEALRAPAPVRPVPKPGRSQLGGARRVKSDTTNGLHALLGKQLLPLAMTLFIGWLIWGKIAHLDLAAIAASITTIRPGQWGLAGLATLGSFWAVGQYDRVLHAQLGTGISARAARLSGIAAIGLSQSLGFGALTGTLIRWRMLPELTLWQAARLSAAVALSFLAGWAVVAAFAVLAFQPDIPWMKSLATGAIALATVMAVISVYPPGPLVRVPWPSLRAMGTVIGLAACDTILAGLALYALMPPELHLAIGQTISAYLFSLGAGIIGSTPGGVGPFEVTLASLLHSIELEQLLGAVLAFRLVYYALPATLAGLLILRGPRACSLSHEPGLVKTKRAPYLTPEMELQLFSAPRAEANLLRTRDFSLLTSEKGLPVGLAAPIGQSLVMLSDPIAARGCPSAARDALTRTARMRYRMPAIYKCGARMAASARKAGWKVLPAAQEAWLVPSEFSLEGSKTRQLRRVIRKAEEARIKVHEGARDLPLADMDRVAQDWLGLRGKERGFSMGTYDRDYISCQRVFLAYQGAKLVAFISLHESRHEMTLDLMRASPAAPDGTIQLLIIEAIRAAAAYGCPRLSLAAVPWNGQDAGTLTRWIRAKFLAKSGAAGLRRFKSAFAPQWETLYLAAPSRLALVVAGMDVLRRVTAPPPKPTANPMKASRFATHRTLHVFRRRPRAVD